MHGLGREGHPGLWGAAGDTPKTHPGHLRKGIAQPRAPSSYSSSSPSHDTHRDSVWIFLPDLFSFLFPILKGVILLILELHDGPQVFLDPRTGPPDALADDCGSGVSPPSADCCGSQARRGSVRTRRQPPRRARGSGCRRRAPRPAGGMPPGEATRAAQPPSAGNTQTPRRACAGIVTSAAPPPARPTLSGRGGHRKLTAMYFSLSRLILSRRNLTTSNTDFSFIFYCRLIVKVVLKPKGKYSKDDIPPSP